MKPEMIRTAVMSAGSDPAKNSLRVTEIYKSVQGESTWAGLPCTFVRLARCPLRCVWCDTAYSFRGGEKMTLGAIVKGCDGHGCGLVEITGGEPLVQGGCPALAKLLLDSGHTVLVETSGSLPIDVLPAEAIKIMDLKCPGSGECNKNYWPNIDALSPRDEVKFVIVDREDYDWSKSVVSEHRLSKRCKAVLFSPVLDALEPKTLVDWVLADGLDVRVQLQLHKFIWTPDTKGV